MNKLISIALATYNGDKYLREQLDSIYKQTYDNIEVIVRDDKSTDGTVEILEEYKKKYGLKYSVNNKNLGFVKNFEKVLMECKGEYIALCDQDDLWFPEKIKVLVNEINNSSLICSDAIVIDGDGIYLAKSMYAYTKRKFYYMDQFNHLLYHNYITGCTLLIKRELLNKSLPFPLWVKYHDWWLAIMASVSDGIRFTDKSLMSYRYHGHNQSTTGLKYKYKSLINKIAEFRNKTDTGGYIDEIIWIEDLLTKDFIDSKKRKILEERLLFYKNISNSRIHFKSAIIAFKHRKYMLSTRNIFDQIFFILMTLFAK